MACLSKFNPSNQSTNDVQLREVVCHKYRKISDVKIKWSDIMQYVICENRINLFIAHCRLFG